jgi:hypothetical protein
MNVTGKVTQAGQPIGNFAVSFHPLDHGYVTNVDVRPDGTFQGDLIAGKYSYSLVQSSNPASAQALQKVAPQYLEPNLERTVSIEPGQELQIVLD